MSSLQWDRILVGITCCVVTVTLLALCIWQLVLRFKTDTTESVVPPCFCLNGGICQAGACMCPEEWVGSLCEIVNFCAASTSTVNISESVIKNLTFERIIVGKYGNSKEKCEPDTVNANASIAIRLCSREGRTPILKLPQILNCNENLDSLALQVETADSSNVSAIATNTQILTSMPDQLTSQNISAAANIAVQILKKPNVSEDSRASLAVMTTVSQLMDANETEFNYNLVNITTSLTKTMEEFSLTGNISQPNVAIQSAPLKLSSSTILFSAQRDTTLGYYQSTKLEVEQNVPGLISDLSTEVQILLNITNNSSSHNGRAGFVLYQNDKLFQSRIYKSRSSFSKQIVSGNIDGGTTSGVEIAFSPKYNTSQLQLRDHACVFWDYTVNDWSTAGCGKARDQFLRCRCNHTTNFAVLMAFQIKYKYAKPLEYISYIGVGLSVAGLVITILFQIFTRKNRKSSITWMLVSLCFSMLIFNIIFISGIENKNARNHSSNTTSYYQQYPASNTLLTSDVVDPPADTWCTAVAVLLHYFLLATFMWTALNSAQLYLLLLRAMKPLPGHFLITMSLIGWGIPAVVVAITLGATYREGKALNYRQEEFCWLAALDQNQNFSVQKPMLWSFLLPVALILLFNIIIFIKISISVIWKKNENLTRHKKDSFMKKVIATISIVVVLGITWTIGYLMLISHEETHTVFSYLFCILNATQGLQICILYTFRSPIFKKKVSEVFPIFQVPEVPLYLHSKTYYISKSQSAKHSQETFRSTQTFSENISLSTFPDSS
ncbi:PREDICTED: probable G-protein coupled receptor 128 [Chlamydotis macqueenii]|uniref:probable G-protein coupled receptor 128 n=1 Tax=Chlamydotis macqueenii TaxID=187382 RepID=UPI000529F647|nr:PREDICTED: probable G-protein coupled receptor 128 [Chlamydotis macqueenii]